MKEPDSSRGDAASDLFDRWLARREEPTAATRAPVGPPTPDAPLRAEQVALAERLAGEARRAEQVRLAGAPLPVEPTAASPTESPAESVLLPTSAPRRNRLIGRRRAPEPEPAEHTGPPRVVLVSSTSSLLQAGAAPTPSPPPVVAPEPESGPGPGPGTPVDNGEVTFAPRRAARRVVGLLLLASLLATVLAGREARLSPTTDTIAVAVALGVLTLVLWALRAGSSSPRLRVSNGQLEVRSSNGRFVFDLASPYTPIEVVGTAGSRGWKVLFVRRGMSPFVVDSSMVDPTHFMTVLRRHRPAPQS